VSNDSNQCGPALATSAQRFHAQFLREGLHPLLFEIAVY
jgi:hypothetical protein